MAPRPDELDGLSKAGLQVKRGEPGSDYEWQLEVRHPDWGSADIFCPRGMPLPPSELIEWDPRLSRQEKEEVAVYGSAVFVRAEPQQHDVLRDRKILLRFLRAVVGSHGLFAMDHVAQSCWSRSALDEELGHDAPLDIASVFTIHMVGNSPKGVHWLHSHGLQDLGFCEFDLIEPHPSGYQDGYDSLRALAFAIVEGKLAPDGGAFDLVQPGGTVQLVSARRFLEQARPGDWPRWRAEVDDQHLDGHAVVCDPARRSWFGLGGKALSPANLYTQPFPDGGIIQFSSDASLLMADRARQTYAVFRALLEELAAYSLPALVKLGYVVDDAGEGRGGDFAFDHEHLWFEVHACREREIDATLINQPFRIARLRPGDRAAHSVDLLSDWQILTPYGSITPRFGRALRDARDHPDELRRLLAEARAQGG